MQYSISMYLTRHYSSVTVEADSPEQALAKAKAGEWDDENDGTLMDWEVCGKPKLVEEGD